MGDVSCLTDNKMLEQEVLLLAELHKKGYRTHSCSQSLFSKPVFILRGMYTCACEYREKENVLKHHVFV